MNDQLITLLVFGLIAAISTWLNKRRQAQAEAEESGTAPPRRERADSPPERAVSWEEEMRRLLEGQPPATPPSRPSPAVRQPVSPPVIRSSPVPPPVVVSDQRARSGPSTEVLLEQARGHREEARLKKVQAEARLRSVLQQAQLSERPKPVAGRRVRQMLGDRDSLRSAFLVSLVFGPPKGLSNQ